jgi:conjugative relaxase-like TrwC/TraI family protein
MQVITDVNSLSGYLGKGDGGYFVEQTGLHREVGGELCERLGLSEPDFKKFLPLMHGLDPNTGEQLTAKLVENRIPGWHLTVSVPKGVTIAIEHGDYRVHDALWEAARETIADVQRLVTTRVRKGGVHDDRLTGSLGYYAEEHAETRPTRQDSLADPDRHIHIILPNISWDDVENEFKAIKFRPVMDLRKWLDRRLDSRLASKLTDLGYGIETKYKNDDRGNRKYFSWDIKGMPQSVVAKFSRRAGEVEFLAAKLGIENPQSKDKLGATSRLHKRDDMTLEDYRKYWLGRITPAEDQKLKEVINAANMGQNPEPQNTADKGMAYAIGHHFERQSVIGQKDLEIAAMERCMGGALPEEIMPEAIKQGVLLRDGQATTKEVLAEENRIIDFAREGKGTMRPMGDPESRRGLNPSGASNHHDTATLFASGQQKGRPDGSKRPVHEVGAPVPSVGSTLSPEQQAMVSHVLKSTDQVVLVIGDAGTGKTRSIKAAFQEIDRPIEMLAPSADASRGVLREEGFSKADTVASFLMSEDRQVAVKNGVLWIDEAGLLPIKDLFRLTEIARQQNARIVLMGDNKQHSSPARHGNMMNVLQEYAGLPVGRLTEIWRQQHKGYKQVVADIAARKGSQAFDRLTEMGWVKQVEGNTPLVDDYLAGLNAGKQMLVVAPTHIEGQEITAEIRQRLKLEGKLGKEDTTVEQLKPLNWTEAERGDLERYDGTETLVFHRNSGTFKAGDRVRVADWKKGDHFKSSSHFSVYTPGATAVAAGDTIRITANGKTKDDHKLNNGAIYKVKGFDKDGDIILANGWTVGADYGHLTHGYVSTSHAAQGKTVDRVLIAMGSESLPAINADQFYVSVSRGRERATIYSDMAPAELKEAIQRTDPRKSATELMTPVTPKRRNRVRNILKMARERLKRLRENVVDVTRGMTKQKEREYAGIER